MFAPKSTRQHAARAQPPSASVVDHERADGERRASQVTQRAAARPRLLAPAAVLRLQGSLGNRATQAVLRGTALTGAAVVQRQLDAAYLTSWASRKVANDKTWNDVVDHLAGYQVLVRVQASSQQKADKLQAVLTDIKRWISSNEKAVRPKEQRKFHLTSPKSWPPVTAPEERFDQMSELQEQALAEFKVQDESIDRLTTSKVRTMLQAIQEQKNILSRKRLFDALTRACKEQSRRDPQAKEWGELENHVTTLGAEIDQQMSKHPAIEQLQESASNIRADARDALIGRQNATSVGQQLAGGAEAWVRTSLEMLMPTDAPAYIVVALGSFARMEMALFSDTDMVLICEEKDTVVLKQLMAAYGAMRTRINEGNKAFLHDPVIGDVFSVDDFARAGFTDKPPDLRLIHARPSGAIELYKQVLAKRQSPNVGTLLKSALTNLPAAPKIDLSENEFHVKDLVLKPIITPIALLANIDQRRDPSTAEPTVARLRAAKDSSAAKMAEHFEFFLNLRHRLHAEAGSERDIIVKGGKLWSPEVANALSRFGTDYPGYLAYIQEAAKAH
jgi:hypothetical protein